MFHTAVQLLAVALLASSATALPKPHPSLPSAQEAEAWARDNNITAIQGHYDPTSDLSKRSTPPACAFETNRGEYWYTYYPDLADGGDACFGYTQPICGQGMWGGQAFEDLQNALAILVTKDGAMSKGTAGKWKAMFFLFTSAFKQRETYTFVLGLLQADRKSAVYYWSRDNDFASIIGNDGECFDDY